MLRRPSCLDAVHQACVARNELGKRDGNGETLRKLAEALAVSLDEIVAPPADEKQPWSPREHDKFQRLIQSEPGITTAEVAKRLGIGISHAGKTLRWRLDRGFVSYIPGSWPRHWVLPSTSE